MMYGAHFNLILYNNNTTHKHKPKAAITVDILCCLSCEVFRPKGFITHGDTHAITPPAEEGTVAVPLFINLSMSHEKRNMFTSQPKCQVGMVKMIL